jgi:[ribosomal protein S18]-alanine N-acetyltransferase
VTEARIRPATAGDIRALVALERECFTDPWSARSFESALANPMVQMLCLDAPDGAELHGYLVAWFVGAEGEIANLAVHPAVRRSGIGRAMIDAIIAEAERQGVRALFLEVRESNEAARRLYGSRGFTEVGRRRRYYRLPPEDAIVLRRSSEIPGAESGDDRAGSFDGDP